MIYDICFRIHTVTTGDLYFADSPYQHMIPTGAAKVDKNNLGLVG